MSIAPTPIHEPEVDLKEMGCPYNSVEQLDFTLAWLKGYQAGYAKASDVGIAALERLAKS